MQKTTLSKNQPAPPSKVDFQDMEHTLEWLMEMLEQYEIGEAYQPLELVQKLVARKKAEVLSS